LENRHARGIVTNHKRWRSAGRHQPKKGLRYARYLGQRGSNFCIGVEENLDDIDAVISLALDVLDVVNRRCERSLEDGSDAARELRRRHTGVLPDNADDRDIDIRKNVGRGPQDYQRADDQ